jgi:hypothetical protein
MAEVGLLPFARIALQVSRAVLPRYGSRFSKRQFTQPQLLAVDLDQQFVLSQPGAVHGTTVRICPRSSTQLPSKPASGWCWRTRSSKASAITPTSANASERRA